MQIKVKQIDQINYPSFLLEFHFLAAETFRNESVIIIITLWSTRRLIIFILLNVQNEVLSSCVHSSILIDSE